MPANPSLYTPPTDPLDDLIKPTKSKPNVVPGMGVATTGADNSGTGSSADPKLALMTSGQNSATPPMPTAPKPGPDWVPTADGQGWLPPDQAESDQAWHPPASSPEREAGPVSADPAASGGDPDRVAAPKLGPLVDDNGTTSHQPKPWEPQRPAGPAGPGGNRPQDPLRDLLIKMMGQKEVPDVNDPSIRAQLDPYRAEYTRQMRDQVRAEAESGFAGGQDFGSPERMAAAERAGNKTGLMASDLVGRELTARRDQIRSAMAQYGSQLDAEQQRALTEKLAMIDAALKGRGLDISETQGARQLDQGEKRLALDRYLADKGFQGADLDRELKKYLGDKDYQLATTDQDLRRLGLIQTGQLGNRELDVRGQLGNRGLDIDALRTWLQNDQFNKNFGLDIGKTQAQLNRDAMLQSMNG